MSKGPEQYRGDLTAAQIAEGIEAARANGLRLLEDARHLLESGRYASACALAILAIEEDGKITILRRMAACGPSRTKEAWRDYRNHRAKNAKWIMPDLYAKGARKAADFAATVDSKADHTLTLDVLKQLSIYSDCVERGRWHQPGAWADKDTAENLMWLAELLRTKNEIPVREIELWREIVGPHYAMPTMTDAVIEWARVMNAEGLRCHAPEMYAEFLAGLPGQSDGSA